MATYVELISANGLWLNLAASPYGVGTGGGLGTPEVDNVLAAPWQLGHERIIAYNVRNRRVELALNISGATRDAWAAAYQDLARILRDAKDRRAAAWLNVHFDGATNPTVFDVVGGEVPDAAYFDHDYVLQRTTIHRPVMLYLRPFGHPQAHSTAASGTITNGSASAGWWSQGATSGERRAPARLQFSSPATTVRQVLLARMSGNAVEQFPWVMDAETGGTHADYSVAVTNTTVTSSDQAVAAAHNGNVRRISATSGQSGSVKWTYTVLKNLAAYEGRRFHVWLRQDSTPANAGPWSTITATLKWGGLLGEEYTAVKGSVNLMATGAGTDSLSYLGYFEIPRTERPLDTKFIFTVTVSVTNGSGGTSTRDIDCVYVVPGDEYYAMLPIPTFKAALAANDIIELDGIANRRLPTVLSSAGLVQTISWDSYLVAPNPDALAGVPMRWFVLIGTGNTGANRDLIVTHDLTQTCTLRLWWHDLYDLVR